MSLADDWALLAIAPTDDRREIKRAYGRVLKTIDVDADPAAFIRLREAMESCLAWGTAVPDWEAAVLPADGEHPAEDAWWPEDEQDPEPVFSDPAHGWAFRWRPEMPAMASEALARAGERLDLLLFGEEAPAPELVEAAGKAILADIPTGGVDSEMALEQWLAQAIAAAPPRSDPLIEPATARFGWAQAERRWRQDPSIEAVLERRRSLAYLARCRQSYGPHSDALAELLGPPRRRLAPWDYGLIARVEDFLNEMALDHPALEPSLNQESLGWWRAYLEGPHPPRFFWPAMVMGPVVATFVLALLLSNRGFSAAWIFLVYPPIAALTAAGLFAYGRLEARARRRSAASGPRSFAALALPLFAPVPFAFLPPNPDFMILTTFVAVVLFVRFMMSIMVRRRFDGSPLLPGAAALAALTSLFAMPVDTAFILAPLLLVACLVGLRVYPAAQARLAGWQPAARRRLLAGLLALDAAAGAALVGFGWPAPPWALTLAIGTVLAAHLASGGSGVDRHWAEWPIRALAAAGYFTLSAPLGGKAPALLAALLAYGLLYGAARVAVAWLSESAARG